MGTAGLDLDSIVPILTDPAFSLLGSTGFANHAALTTEGYSVTFDTSALGAFTASWQLQFSDQDLPCATAPGSELLLLTVMGTTTAPEEETPEIEGVPEPSTIALAFVGLVGLGMHIHRRRICR